MGPEILCALHCCKSDVVSTICGEGQQPRPTDSLGTLAVFLLGYSCTYLSNRLATSSVRDLWAEYSVGHDRRQRFHAWPGTGKFAGGEAFECQKALASRAIYYY